MMYNERKENVLMVMNFSHNIYFFGNTNCVFLLKQDLKIYLNYK